MKFIHGPSPSARHPWASVQGRADPTLACKIALWMRAVQSTLAAGDQPSVPPRLRRIFLQNLVECLHEQVCIACGENQRRPQLNHVVIRPIRAA
jgi:hypothetical protein